MTLIQQLAAKRAEIAQWHEKNDATGQLSSDQQEEIDALNKAMADIKTEIRACFAPTIRAVSFAEEWLTGNPSQN